MLYDNYTKVTMIFHDSSEVTLHFRYLHLPFIFQLYGSNYMSSEVASFNSFGVIAPTNSTNICAWSVGT